MWRTVADEEGQVRSYPSYPAAKRALLPRPGQELHHLVEQCKAKPERSDFDVERINTTDNFVWLPTPVHRTVSKRYSAKIRGFNVTLRDALNGESWERQYARGVREVNRAFEEHDSDD